MKRPNRIDVFFALLRAGLWENNTQLLPYGEIDYDELFILSEYQAVTGLVTAGLEHVSDVIIPKDNVLAFVGNALQLEQRNAAMNYLIGVLVDKMRDVGIYTILVKGQGVAQCYERPLWRTCGDVDFFLSDINYQKAKDFLIPLASSVDKEDTYEKHISMQIDSWVVELHGNLKGGLSYRIDKTLDAIYTDTFYGGNVRSWLNGNTQVFLLSVDNDVIYIFVHILQHFFHGGIGLRQICDWSRFIWVNRKILDISKLEERLTSMKLITEWKSFAAFVVEDLGFPNDEMPLFDNASQFVRRAKRIRDFVIKSGNFGHRDLSYVRKHSYFIRKIISLTKAIKSITQHIVIFPLDSLRFFFYYSFIRLRAFSKGE